MIKKWLIVFFTLSLLFLFKTAASTVAVEPVQIVITPIACQGNPCPDIMRNQVYPAISERNQRMNPPLPVEECAVDYPDFLTGDHPTRKHFWAEDPQITAQGKADERARQFIYWVLNKNAIDDHPIIKTVWNTTSSMAFIFMLLIAAVMGLGFIVAQRSNFQINLKVWPYITKLALALLYIFFSWLIVLSLIQISEWIMKLFIDNLGGKNLFNVYFNSDSGSSEDNYTSFIGCRDLNIRVQEAADAQMFIFKATNITYYAMGIMLILRKILLWFLLFVAPFLAILMPFVFVRNVGWIWIGVFFQWLFYGPLFALFLGALNKMWSTGIPFAFDFSRAGDVKGYIYPTALILIYGGPGQRDGGPGVPISGLNNGNYIDTFAEYVITLIMLWAVIFFPWWLLRIFRDYCCDGIYAMKNILLSMYDQMRGGPSPTPPPSGPNYTGGVTIKTQKEVDTPVRVKLETIEEIKRTKTEDITRSLNLTATKLTDIARFETDKKSEETVKKTLNYLSNPTKAETPTERQKFMNIRTELFNRAIKDDRNARQILSATSSSAGERIQKREELLRTTPQMQPISTIVSVKVQLPSEKISSVNNTLVTSITNNNNAVNSIAESTNVPAPEVQSILASFRRQTTQVSSNTIDNVAEETGIDKESVVRVINNITHVVKNNKALAQQIAQKEDISEDQLQKIVDTQMPILTEPAKSIEQTIAIPPTVSIEDYEEVKKMWTHQYEKGEVPESDDVKTREDWIDQDIVFLTNTLNKLVSVEERLKQEGIDELGYILPIFLINNMKGDELMVYLKAKLEAAKAIKEDLVKEEEITEKVKAEAEQQEDDLVEVDRPKAAEAENELHMSQELETPETETPSTGEEPATQETPASDEQPAEPEKKDNT